MPTSTDLVTDLPADFNIFGQGVDTSLQDLLGGTTGQVLSKASNTNMDFAWVAQDDSNAIQNAIVDAKGDLIGATAADTPARLAVGANGTVLTADSAESTGLKWATPSSDFVRITTQSFTSSAAVNVNDVFSSTYKNYKVFLNVTNSTGAGLLYRYRVAGADNTTSNYAYQRLILSNSSFNNVRETAQTNGALGDTTTTNCNWELTFFNPFETKLSYAYSNTAISASSPEIHLWNNGFNATTSFTGFTLYPSSGTITGEILVYGMKVA
jgi:hypothetical protein